MKDIFIVSKLRCCSVGYLP